MIEQRESGLYVITADPKPAPPEAEPTGIKCSGCERRSVAEWSIVGQQYRTRDGFYVHSPVCKHGTYLLCPDCEAPDFGCPQCGTREEYC